MNIQVIVTFDGRIISYELGWPGCTPDVTILKNSHFWIHRDDYLSPGEWVMADSGKHNLSLLVSDSVY